MDLDETQYIINDDSDDIFKMGKNYQDVQNKKVDTGTVLGAQTRSKSFGISTSKICENKTYTQAVTSPVNTSNLATGRKFIVLNRNICKSE